MVTYDQWNKAIISHFFEDHDDLDQIVFLQTDANTLFDIATKSTFNVADADTAADSLARAVQDKMVCDDSALLSTVTPTKNQEEPPQVAFLALTVFAASRMSSEGSISFRDYYTRLNEVLFDKSVPNIPQGFDRHHFEALWIDIQKWVKCEHNLDLHLTRGSRNGWCVWYPKSQCLITKHDQRAIYTFFRRNKLTPVSDLSDDDLERRLRYWMSSPTSASKIERYLSNEIYKKAILRQVISLLRNWDGEIPPKFPSHGRQRTIRIDVEFRLKGFDNTEIRYWFRKRGGDEVDCKPNPLGIERLRLLSNSEKWFRPEIDNTGKFWNWSSLDRLQLQTDKTNSVVYTLSVSDLWVFREDSERDGWFSQERMQLYEDHLIVFQKRLAGQVMNCLRQTCEQDVETPNPIYVDSKESDWFYLPVKPTKCLSFDKHLVWKLSVVYSKQIRFIGGLSVKDQNGHRVYLDIWLPSVFVPDMENSVDLSLQVDDQLFLVGADRLVRLQNKLGIGIHQLSYGKKTRELRVIAPDRSLKHKKKTLTSALSEDQKTIPSYSKKRIADIREKPGLWLTGTKFLGMDIPKVTWDDVQTEPLIPTDGIPKSPADLISSVVKVAIALKQGGMPVPDWFDSTLEHLNQNIGIRILVEKKLRGYSETALSYVDLCKRIKG